MEVFIAIVSFVSYWVGLTIGYYEAKKKYTKK